MQTTAAVLHAFREPHAIEEVELRDPGRGEVLVRIVAAGICHSDVGQADGEWGFPLPAVLGHEGAGVVEAVGEGVSGIAPGQRVVLSLAPGCGACGHCEVGRPILCQDSLDAMGEGRLTTGGSPITGPDGPIAAYSLLACFAHHAVVAERSVIPLPDDVPADVAALIGCAVITGVGAAIETLQIPAGSRGAVDRRRRCRSERDSGRPPEGRGADRRLRRLAGAARAVGALRRILRSRRSR